MVTTLEDLVAGDLQATMEYSIDTKELRNVMKGTADFRVLVTLKNYLRRVNEVALKNGATAVTFDWRPLKFMNSSCLKNFVWFLSLVNDLPEPTRYRVSFVTGASLHWQKTSLSALACIGDKNMTIFTA